MGKHQLQWEDKYKHEEELNGSGMGIILTAVEGRVETGGGRGMEMLSTEVEGRV